MRNLIVQFLHKQISKITRALNSRKRGDSSHSLLSSLSLLTFSLIKNTNSLQWNKIKPNCSFNSFTQKKKKNKFHYFTFSLREKNSNFHLSKSISINSFVKTKRLLNQDYYTTSSRKKISKPKLRYQSRTIL